MKSFVMLGHRECGKSVLASKLLYLNNFASDQRLCKKLSSMSEMEKMSYQLDMLKQEKYWRESTTPIFREAYLIKHQQMDFNIVDFPSYYRCLTKYTLSGISAADIGILVVAASPGEFEAGISSEGKTREHAIIAFANGITQLIVCINKMDDKEVAYSRQRYEEVKKQVHNYLIKIGYKQQNLCYLPISARKEQNIQSKSTSMLWYEGPTLCEIMDAIVVKDKESKQKLPFRMPIQKVYQIRGVGTVVTGRVMSGEIKVGQKVFIEPQKLQSTVSSIESFNESIEVGKVGNYIGINIKGIEKGQIRKGNVLTLEKSDKLIHSILCQTAILNPVGKILKQGAKLMIACHCEIVQFEVLEVVEYLDPKTGKPTEVKTKQRPSAGSRVRVQLKPIRNLFCETFQAHSRFGRIVLMSGRTIVGVGIIKDTIFAN